MNSEVFRKEITRMLNEGKSMGKGYIDITSGEVHREVGGYPSTNHRMATCCDVMYSMKKPGDEILNAPAKCNGATLTIRYYL